MGIKPALWNAVQFAEGPVREGGLIWGIGQLGWGAKTPVLEELG